MIGDRARLAPGMKVMGINGRLFSPQRLQDALADSVALRKIELLLLEEDRFRTVVLDYAEGPKYVELVRDNSKPDLLAEILKPIATTRQPAAKTEGNGKPQRLTSCKDETTKQGRREMEPRNKEEER